MSFAGRLRAPQRGMRVFGMPLVMALAVAACAKPPPPPPFKAEDKLMWREELDKLPPNTSFDQLPAPVEVMEVYPPLARENEMEGRVYLRCTVREDRRPHDCTVLQEPYAGVGFGEAAIKLAARYRFTPGERTPPYKVVIPIFFRLSP